MPPSKRVRSKEIVVADDANNAPSRPEVVIARPGGDGVYMAQLSSGQTLEVVLVGDNSTNGKLAEQSKKESRDSLPRALILAAAAAVVAGAFGLGQAAMSEPTESESSICANAHANVKRDVDAGVRDPELLETINDESVDAQCGEEVAIARDMLRTAADRGTTDSVGEW